MLALALVAASLSAGAAAALPQPSGGNDRLYGVSCPKATDCWAVGSSQAQGSNHVTGQILHWTGATWMAVATPAGGGLLTSVTCPSVASCWAVGNTNDGGATYPKPVLIHWDGSSWSRVAPPRLREAGFFAVTCRGTRNCWIVGDQARDRTLALHWDGAHWKLTTTPNPSRFQRQLSSVTCVAARSCWAAGFYYGPPGTPTLTAYLTMLHWDGSAWKRAWTSPPYLGGESSQAVSLDAISCPTRSNCLAVGSAVNSLFYPSPVAVRWDGHRWSRVATANVRFASLGGVVCTSTRHCLTVGEAGALLGAQTHGLAEVSNGSHWARTSLPRGPFQLNGVSCTGASDCWAVGQGRAGNVALRWNGSRWAAY